MIKTVNETPQWYVLYTRSRAEKKVAALLTEKGLEIYLPLLSQWKQWSDRKKKIDCPLIPSVVFIKTTAKDLTTIVRYENIVRTLFYMGKPAVVREEEIDTLRQLCSEGSHVTLCTPMDFYNGEEIEIIRGQFAGIKGKYLYHQGKYKVFVVIEAIGSCFQLEVALNNIQKTSISA